MRTALTRTDVAASRATRLPGRDAASGRRRPLVLVAFATLAACAVVRDGAPTSSARRGAGEHARGDDAGARVKSNIERGDYAGSQACRPCHAVEAQGWDRSPMHGMTRNVVTGTEIRAPFDGTTWHFKGDTATLERQGDARFVRIDAQGRATKVYRVTRIVGGRTREDFVGIDAAAGGEELVLPVSFLISSGSLRYKGYSVMVHERDELRAGPVWREACIFCHNTVPELDRVLGEVVARQAARDPMQAVDRWLPPDRREHLAVTDEGAFERAASSEAARLGAPASVSAIEAVRGRLDASALVEVGIGCEACHGGAREHVENPRVRPAWTAVAPWLRTQLPAGSAQAQNRICARCHQVLFSRYPFTWEGGRRVSGAGGSSINSGEGRDFLLGGCASAMACSRCHDPHKGSDRDALRALATPAGNSVCTGCHAAFAAPADLRAHAHHDPESAGGSCLGCHMPRKNMGLEGTLTRYHRIGSPTDAARVLGDRPLECAFCHRDRSVRDLVGAMEAWWPVRYPRQRLEELYGSLDANVLEATLDRGKPHERVAALATLGELGRRGAAPAIGRELLDEYPLVREWAKRSLGRLLGRCDVDLGADDAAIAAQAAVGCGAVAPVAPAPRAHADEPPED